MSWRTLKQPCLYDHRVVFRIISFWKGTVFSWPNFLAQLNNLRRSRTINFKAVVLVSMSFRKSKSIRRYPPPFPDIPAPTSQNHNISTPTFYRSMSRLRIYRSFIFFAIFSDCFVGKKFNLILFRKTCLFLEFLQFISLDQGKLQTFFLIFVTVEFIFRWILFFLSLH